MQDGNKIKVIDALMSKGKTNWAFKYMKNNPNKKFIYITPYLLEIERLVKNNNSDDGNNFSEPKQLGTGKLDSLHELLSRGCNIATTHSLFSMANKETTKLIKNGGYILILDEVFNAMELVNITNRDFEIVKNSNLISINDKGEVKWIDDKYDGKFNGLRKLCEEGNVIVIKDTITISLLVWNFKSKIFKAFDDIFVMTYLFDASMLKYYFNINNMEYDLYTIQDSKLIKFSDKKPYDKTKIKSLINVYEGKLNKIGDKDYSLSKTWFDKNVVSTKKLKNNTINYLKNIIKAKSNDILWTTFKDHNIKMSGKGYTRGFIPLNTRATNKYSDKSTLVYLCNRFLNPNYVNYFSAYDIEMNQDIYALSELLQWIWRSRIRLDEPINVYIPSMRMRELLIDWLDNEDI